MKLSMTKASKALYLTLGAVAASALSYFGFRFLGWSVGQSAVTAGILLVAGGLCGKSVV